MKKPYLIIVTGRPGSGKTTLAQKFSDFSHMQMISRDKIKEGYVHTMEDKHDNLSPDTNLTVTNIFFDTVKSLLKNNVSLIIEAAFQHKVWVYMLSGFEEICDMSFIICDVDKKLAFKRYKSRGNSDKSRVYFHGDSVQNDIDEDKTPQYTPPSLPVPTYNVDTTGEYNPSIKNLCKAIFKDESIKKLLTNDTI